MKAYFLRFIQDESGATAIEYGLIAAIVGVGIITGLGSLKTSLNDKFTSIGTSIASAGK